MKNMFYNYDHNIDTSTEESCACYNKQFKKLATCTSATKLYNIKGDELGIKAKVNSTFSLYFNIKGCFEDGTLREFLENGKICFDVLNFKHEPIASFEPELDSYKEEVKVTLVASEDGPLKFGVYRMHLYVIYNEQKYTLVSSEAGILSIE